MRTSTTPSPVGAQKPARAGHGCRLRATETEARRLARDERRDHALGHPLPLSNFSDVRKRGVSHAVHTSTPGSLSSFSGLDHGGSVPASRSTSNSWGVSASRHTAASTRRAVLAPYANARKCNLVCRFSPSADTRSAFNTHPVDRTDEGAFLQGVARPHALCLRRALLQQESELEG